MPTFESRTQSIPATTQTPEDSFRNTGKRPTQGRGVGYEKQSHDLHFVAPRDTFFVFQTHGNTFSHTVCLYEDIQNHERCGHICARSISELLIKSILTLLYITNRYFHVYQITNVQRPEVTKQSRRGLHDGLHCVW